jgi:hypothetical protein
MAVREFIDLMPFTCNEIKGFKAPAFPITGTRLKYWSNDKVTSLVLIKVPNKLNKENPILKEASMHA